MLYAYIKHTPFGGSSEPLFIGTRACYIPQMTKSQLIVKIFDSHLFFVFIMMTFINCAELLSIGYFLIGFFFGEEITTIWWILALLVSGVIRTISIYAAIEYDFPKNLFTDSDKWEPFAGYYVMFMLFSGDLLSIFATGMVTFAIISVSVKCIILALFAGAEGWTLDSWIKKHQQRNDQYQLLLYACKKIEKEKLENSKQQ